MKFGVLFCSSLRPLTEDFRYGIGRLRLSERTEILTELISQKIVVQELDERGSQGVGGGRGGFGHEGGGVVGEQAGVETLVVVSGTKRAGSPTHASSASVVAPARNRLCGSSQTSNGSAGLLRRPAASQVRCSRPVRRQ